MGPTRAKIVSGFLAAFILAAGAGGCGRRDSPQVALQGDRFDPVRRLIKKTFKKRKTASIAIAAARGGEIIWEEAFGWADVEKRIPADPGSVYALASISKSLTATGLMILKERGLVDLDRPVDDYLGGAALFAPGGDAGQATVRRVLQFTAGLPTHYNLFFVGSGYSPPRQAESIRRYGMIVEEPGRYYNYSNFGYGLIDRVISVVAGKSFEEFMKVEVFDPLGLSHSSVGVDSNTAPFLVTHYDPSGGRVPVIESDHRGASAVYSSVHDLIRYGIFHLGGASAEGSPVLGSAMIEEMHTPSSMIVPGENIGEVRMGLGWAVVDLEGVRFLVASGGMPGTVTRLTLIPEEDVAVAMTINTGLSETWSPWEIEWETFSEMIEDFPEMPKVKAERERPGKMPEGFRGMWSGTVRTPGGDLPVSLDFRYGWNPILEIDGRKSRTIRRRNPLGGARFDGDLFESPFVGNMPAEDCRRAGHVLFLRLRLRGDTLSGVLSAVAKDRTFWLPHWISLERELAMEESR